MAVCKNIDSKIIMGLDLSLNSTGISIIEILNNREVKILNEERVRNDFINPSNRGEKLFKIYYGIEELLDIYAGTSLIIVKEKGFTKFTKATQALFEVSGVTELVMFCNNRVIEDEITPTSVKKYITGNGKASKEDVDKGLREYLIREQKGYKFTSNDTSDATAVAIAYAIKNKLLECGGN